MGKKLIEVALPLEIINTESAREKSIRHGHPSTLHLYWSRKPTATARAVIWASLVDDPSAHPELFPTAEEQLAERERLFSILEKLVVWENTKDYAILQQARNEIQKSTRGSAPVFLDPFAGGGAIPLEAERLGLEAHAHDLNPVSVIINKAMIEFPARFDGRAPINPRARKKLDFVETDWHGTLGLVDDIDYYGEWIKKEAYNRIGELYPRVRTKNEHGEEELTVIAWLWTRTVRCPNPACEKEAPLISSYVLSKKAGSESWIKPVLCEGKLNFEVQHGAYDKCLENGTKFINARGKASKGKFTCPYCGTLITSEYADKEASASRMGVLPLAVVAEGGKGREYLSANEADIREVTRYAEQYYSSHDLDVIVPHEKTRGTFASNAQGGYYGFIEYKDYFTKRQLITLVTFSELIEEVRKKVEADALETGVNNDYVKLESGGNGVKAYGEAIAVYLSFILSKIADRGSSLCSWDSSRDGLRNTFSMQAIPMVWTFAEGNPFCKSSGSFDNMLEWVIKCVSELPTIKEGVAEQVDAQIDSKLRSVMISTDPPYYNNVCYADLSDYFYVWMRIALKNVFPSVFQTLLVPKSEELVASPYRFEGDGNRAKEFFENGMLEACKRMYVSSAEDFPVTIYYAYKQSEVKNDQIISSGWETMLSSIINAGFSITGTWPIRTELGNRRTAQGANSLSSSIVLVCRKRPANAGRATRRSLIGMLRREIRPALKNLQESNIAPVDLAQSAIGPGMAVFSRFHCVYEADGSYMTVRSALQVINEEIDLFFYEQVGDLDATSRFCVDLYSQKAYNDMKYGEAEILANAKGASIPLMSTSPRGVVYAKAGNVHLVERSELTKSVDPAETNIWLLTQQLTQAISVGGIDACADIVVSMLGSNAERAKDLAYRLYTISEKKNWTNEAYAYNSLVVAWPDIQSRAAAMKMENPRQLNMFDDNSRE